MIAVADAAAIADRLRQRFAKRRGGDHIGRHRHQRRGDARHQFAELHISAQHDVIGAQPRAGRDDAFAHARRIDRQSRRVFKNTRAVTLRGSGKLERIVQRMDRERARIIDGVKVALAAQCAAHAIGLPALDLAAQFAEQLDLSSQTRRCCPAWRHGASRLADRCRRRRWLGRPDARNRGRLGTASTDPWCARNRPARSACRRRRQNPAARSRYCGPMRLRPGGLPPATRRTSRCAPLLAPRSGPASPPPITQTSTSRSNDNCGRTAASIFVAAYQVFP